MPPFRGSSPGSICNEAPGSIPSARPITQSLHSFCSYPIKMSKFQRTDRSVCATGRRRFAPCPGRADDRLQFPARLRGLSERRVVMKWSDGAVLAISVACLCAASPGSGYASTLVPQTALPGDCIPKFAVPLPVFGPGGPTPRVNGRTHFALTVAMKEVDQAVLPPGRTDICGLGVTFGKTRLWTYEISD